jgi:hypothetical protein
MFFVYEIAVRTLACVSVLHNFFLPSTEFWELIVKDVNYYEKTDSATQQAYLKLQCNCVLCNTPLELKFESLTGNEIKEEANCPQCEMRTRAKIHSLQ